MNIALWNEPVSDHFARSAETLSQHLQVQVSRNHRRACRDQVVMGVADVALVPTLSVFKEPDLFDVLPAVALSSWQNPFLTLLLREHIGSKIKSVAIDPAFPQEALVAKILLKEHYNASPGFLPVADLADSAIESTDADAAVIVDTRLQDRSDLTGTIDMGQDWFELTHYPLVFGVFVMRKGEATSKAVGQLRDIARYSEHYKQEWLEEQVVSDTYRMFFGEGLRYRLDDLAVASLTAFQDFLYYNEAVEEMTPVPFFEVDEDQDDDDDVPLL